LIRAEQLKSSGQPAAAFISVSFGSIMDDQGREIHRAEDFHDFVRRSEGIVRCGGRGQVYRFNNIGVTVRVVVASGFYPQ